MLTEFFKKNTKINISLPNFHSQVFLNLCFIILQENNKDVFKDNIQITSAEGCFPYSIWSRSRAVNYTTPHDMEVTLKFYSKHNINIRYIFDNSSITKDDIYDTFSNIMLKLAHQKGNGVYVESKILYDYIKKNYPLYDLIKIASIDELKKKNIAVKSKYNNKLNNLIIKHKKRAYITLNPICPDDCEYYEEHRKYIEQEQRNFYDISNVYLCPLKANTGFYDLFKHSNFITEEKMSDFIKAGFRNFRIDFPSIEKCMDINYGLYDTLESYLYYLIKPEYRSKIRNLMIKKYTARKNNG